MEKKKTNFIEKIFGRNDMPDINAEQAWIESTYGFGSYKDVEGRIKEKRQYINACIESKFKQCYQNNNCVSHSSYHCVVDIEEDLAAHINEIFEPFLSNGFTIINISEQVKEIDEPNVYLISWKNAFKNHPKPATEKIELAEE